MNSWGSPSCRGVPNAAQRIKPNALTLTCTVGGWISRQLTEAYGWEKGPCYLVRDRDSAYGEVFIRRLRAMSIRDRPTAPRSPWQNGYCERLIGSIRRECIDYIVVIGEQHLRHLLRAYADYYNHTQTHLSLYKDSPASRAI
jgi:transposase InsO family protein